MTTGVETSASRDGIAIAAVVAVVTFTVLLFSNVGILMGCSTSPGTSCNYAGVYSITIGAPLGLIAVAAYLRTTKLTVRSQVLVTMALAVVVVLGYWFLVPKTGLA